MLLLDCKEEVEDTILLKDDDGLAELVGTLDVLITDEVVEASTDGIEERDATYVQT
jgi:hypothetical protein